MTPQEFDVALKDIRRTRNFMIFFGFIPMIYLFGGALTIASSLKAQNLTVEIITISVVIGLIWGIIRPQKYFPIISKVGLAFLGLSFLGIILISFLPYCETLWLILGGGHVAGFVMFVLSAKVHWSLRMTYIGYYVLMILVIVDALVCGITIKDDCIAYLGIATLIYPMLSSYFAVRWANKEFFKLMNYEK